MEALLLIFGELIFAILAPFVTLVVDLIASIVGVIISILTGSRPGRVLTSRVTRSIAMVLVFIAVLILTAIWTVNHFFFEESVRYVFGQAEKRGGIQTTCQEIDGSLFAGRVDLRNCTIRRPIHPSSSFDLSVDEVTVDLRVTSLLGTAQIDTAHVVGLEGWVKKDRSQVSDIDGSEQPEKPRRAFIIGDLFVSGTSIELSGVNPEGNPFTLPIEIQRIESKPLRSRLALFDILFRSNTSGTIAGSPFEISTSLIPDGRQTSWRAENVPVASFGAVAGGPLSWFSAGSVDVFVDDRWQRGDSTNIDMDWRLMFSNIEVSAPPGTGALARLASEPLARYVNSFDGEFPLEFELVVNENQFEYRSSLVAAGLWTAVGEAVNRTFSAFGIDLGAAADTGDAIKERAKSVLDRIRKPKSEDPD